VREPGRHADRSKARPSAEKSVSRREVEPEVGEQAVLEVCERITYRLDLNVRLLRKESGARNRE
jgi:hypothetical protein